MSMLCKKCNAEMKPGKALNNVPVYGIEDFIGQKDNAGQTFTMQSTGELVDVMKCPECGWSVGGTEKEEE